MIDRKKQIEQLLEKLHSLKRLMTPDNPESINGPCPGRSQSEDQADIAGTSRQSFLDEERLAPSQWLVLHQVGHQNGIGVKELAASLGITSSAATQLVDSLVKKGLLIRQPSEEDRRALRLSLPEESRKRIDTMMAHRLERMVDIFGVLDDVEFQNFLDLINKVIARSQNKKEVV
jgi:DNA-binding MarR family transcriptional regulator